MSSRAAAVVVTGTITDGVIRLDDRVAAAADLKTIRNGGVVLSVEPSTDRSLRSVKLLRYYRGVVVRRIAAASLQPDEAIHAVLAARYLGHAVEFTSPCTGEVFTGVVVRRTSELPPEDLWTYIEQCRAWAHEAYALAIPEPNKDWRLQESAA